MKTRMSRDHVLPPGARELSPSSRTNFEKWETQLRKLVGSSNSEHELPTSKNGKWFELGTRSFENGRQFELGTRSFENGRQFELGTRAPNVGAWEVGTSQFYTLDSRLIPLALGMNLRSSRNFSEAHRKVGQGRSDFVR